MEKDPLQTQILKEENPQTQAYLGKGEWEGAISRLKDEDSELLKSCSSEDLDVLDNAFNVEDINPRYFADFFEEAGDGDRGEMEVALQKLQETKDPAEKKKFAKQVAEMLSNY